MNNVKTFALMAAMTALLLLIGGALAGGTGFTLALIFAVAMNLGVYWYSDQLVLKMFKAEPLGRKHAVYDIVEQLARKAGVVMPKVYMIDNPTPNAFATGRNPDNAAIAVTSGLFSSLNTQELTGVLAHEMAHIAHRDTLISMVAATIAGAISSIANWFMWANIFSSGSEDRPHPVVAILMMIFAPMAAGLIQMAVSRSREYEADAGGARLCGNPLWLASALARLEASNHQGSFKSAEEHPAAAHLFIVNPLSSEKLSELFRTHPLTAERIRRLEALARTGL